MPKCGMYKSDTKNQTLPHGMPQWRDKRKKYNVLSDVRILLGRDCEVEKVMRYFKNIRMFKKI